MQLLNDVCFIKQDESMIFKDLLNVPLTKIGLQIVEFLSVIEISIVLLPMFLQSTIAFSISILPSLFKKELK